MKTIKKERKIQNCESGQEIWDGRSIKQKKIYFTPPYLFEKVHRILTLNFEFTWEKTFSGAKKKENKITQVGQ